MGGWRGLNRTVRRAGWRGECRVEMLLPPPIQTNDQTVAAPVFPTPHVASAVTTSSSAAQRSAARLEGLQPHGPVVALLLVVLARQALVRAVDEAVACQAQVAERGGLAAHVRGAVVLGRLRALLPPLRARRDVLRERGRGRLGSWMGGEGWSSCRERTLSSTQQCYTEYATATAACQCCHACRYVHPHSCRQLDT